MPQQGSHADTLDGADKGAEITQVILVHPQFFLYGFRQRTDGQLTVAEQLGMLGNPALQTQLGQGVGFKQPAIPVKHIGTGSGAVCRHLEGVSGGIGKAEAAGICGCSHIDGLGNSRCHLHI